MRELLKRYGETELDQWEMWRTDTSWGPVYVTIDRAPAPDVDPELYVRF